MKIIPVLFILICFIACQKKSAPKVHSPQNTLTKKSLLKSDWTSDSTLIYSFFRNIHSKNDQKTYQHLLQYQEFQKVVPIIEAKVKNQDFLNKIPAMNTRLNQKHLIRWFQKIQQDSLTFSHFSGPTHTEEYQDCKLHRGYKTFFKKPSGNIAPYKVFNSIIDCGGLQKIYLILDTRSND